jgi:hypothetical protein
MTSVSLFDHRTLIQNCCVGKHVMMFASNLRNKGIELVSVLVLVVYIKYTSDNGQCPT